MIIVKLDTLWLFSVELAEIWEPFFFLVKDHRHHIYCTSKNVDMIMYRNAFCFSWILLFVFLKWTNQNNDAVVGVYLAERLNTVLSENWQKFSTQNYFDTHGIFLSVLWSGPLLITSIVILVSSIFTSPSICSRWDYPCLTSTLALHCSLMQINTMFSLCYLIVRWKRAELRHRARLARDKQD